MDVPNRSKKLLAYPPPDEQVEALTRLNPPVRPTLDQLLKTGLSENDVIEIFYERIDSFATVILSDYIKGPHSEMHLYLYKLFKEKINTGAREIIIAPRGSAKSSLMTLALPLWSVCYEKHRFIVIVSDTQDQAEDFLSWIKEELESSDVIKQLYPYAFGKGEVWRNDRIITKNDILIRSLGSGGKIRGRRYKNHRPDLILGDDLENKQMIDSDTLRRGLVTWFDQDVCKAGARSQDVDIFIAGTILHKESLLNQLYETHKYASWNSVRFQAIQNWCEDAEGLKQWEEWKRILINRYNPLREEEAIRFFMLHEDTMLKGTKILWDNWDTYYSLMHELVVDGEVAFFKEKQNIPQSPEEQIFRNLMFYTEEEFKELKGLFSYVLYLDSSLGKQTKKSDYSAITVLAKHLNTGIYFVRQCKVNRVPVSKQVDDITLIVAFLNAKDIYPRIGVESNAFQTILGDEIKKKLNAEGIRYEKLVKVQHMVEKASRIESLEPPVKNGTIRFRNNEDQELVSQLLWYPQGKDDAVDSLEGAFSMLSQKVFQPSFAIAKPVEYLHVDTYKSRYKKTFLYD